MECTELLLIDKPVGITSFDVIRRLRKELGGWTPKLTKFKIKLGHAGTLDPLASGLMLIGVGEGTKMLTEYIGLDKEYIAEILVGERRSTGDMGGKTLEEKSVDEIFWDEKISSTLSGMLGTLHLPVSAYSAIKMGGVPMYKRARKAEKTGEIVTDVPVRDMEVLEVELLSVKYIAVNRDMDSPTSTAGGTRRAVVTVRFHVGSGTYIRSLAEEFGKRLGYPATLKSLRRTKIGKFDIKDAQAI